MSHAQVEELSDSDPDIDDPSDYLPHSDNQVIRAAAQTQSQSSDSSPSTSPPVSPPARPNPTLLRTPPPSSAAHQFQQPQTREHIKAFQTLYPVYFDSTRTRAEGRRVTSSLAIQNPLAINLLEAVKAVFTETAPLPRIAFEPDKTHPKDWANPGRIRIEMFHPETRQPIHPNIKNKAHLYTLLGRWLKEHPTTPKDPLQLKIPGLPIPETFGKEPIPVPRGWKIGTILPVHSPAVSGGGVKDDFFKEAMEEIRQAQSQGQLPAGGPGGGMPDMSALQSMMSGMGGMGGMPGLGGGMGGESSGGGGGGKKKKERKKG
ncbi:signal recognition particle subunit SRP19 [Capronia coronata CBS 617.96]|uniref:Signal recognition particle subunit SRP19 n=1 Tax=Capronia coronata CBS 617.96 TaxID=1182541 RepID=W9XSM6_9EURO|nr:signal recognition particle subunit SRP19 [Capronia coronata CBS 617.96]EXJ83557.1 signal recognition particle subunit SRP19 [Capronia coronata CBS 617.96]